jgi:hypothetical protein
MWMTEATPPPGNAWRITGHTGSNVGASAIVSERLADFSAR